MYGEGGCDKSIIKTQSNSILPLEGGRAEKQKEKDEETVYRYNGYPCVAFGSMWTTSYT
jgi:hypothetical protein